MARQAQIEDDSAGDLPPRAADRRDEWANSYPSDFETEIVRGEIRRRIHSDDELAMLLEAAEAARDSQDARIDRVGDNDINVSKINEGVGALDYAASERSLEVVAEACESVVQNAEEWAEDENLDADQVRRAVTEARGWMKYHSNEVSRSDADLSIV